MSITVRTARPAEFARAGDLTARAYLDDGLLDLGAADPYLRSLRDAGARAEKAELLVAADPDGTLLGSVTFAVTGPYTQISAPDEAEFRMLAVTSEARGRGVGRALVSACARRATELGCRALLLSTHPLMRSAHRLYERMGFTRVPEQDWSPLADGELRLLVYRLALPAQAAVADLDDAALVKRFVTDGVVRLPGAVAAETAAECAERLWAETGCRPDDPASWTSPVHWIPGLGGGPFAAAASSPVLHHAFDLLAGVGRWQPRSSLGTFPLRFPHPEEPDDAGWHIEASYSGADGAPATNVFSRGRVLLMLFLFSEVGAEDAPTRIRPGSHLDVPRVLAPYGEAGADFRTLGPLVDRASAHRPETAATGSPGDVYLCHPFLVHAAQPHRGQRPRFMAQPPLLPGAPLKPHRPDGDYSPVEAAIRAGLPAT